MIEDFKNKLKKYCKKSIKLTQNYFNLDDLVFDHVCYQTVSKDDYYLALEELKDIIDIISVIPHAGRMLTVAKLKEPYSSKGVTIDRIEISEPKPKRIVRKRNFDHFSFMIKDDFDRFINNAKKHGLIFSEIKQIGNDKLAKFIANGTEIELRDNKLGESIKKKTLIKKKSKFDKDKEKDNSFEELEKQLSLERERKLRALADYQNLQKRVSKDRKSMDFVANTVLLSQILDIIDDFDRVFENISINKKDEEGVKLLRNKLQKVIDESGLVGIECKLKEQLDPNLHEAVGVIAVSSKKDDNAIQQIIQKGYKLKKSNGVVRPVRVIIGKFTK